MKYCSFFFLITLPIVLFYPEKSCGQNDEPSRQRKAPARKGVGVTYHLYVKDTTVNFTGKKQNAIAINGQIPAPTLTFTEGDTAIIYVHNMLDEELSIHWHGILLPNEQDGVPYLTTAPIKAGDTHLFKFPIIQTGTFWYHSHTELQEQAGLYGPLVFRKANETKRDEQVLLLSDWTDIKPKEVLRLLKRNSDWFEIKKGAVQSYGEALLRGHLSDRLKFDWIRMPGADISDVFYPRYLMHGKTNQVFNQYQPGDSVRLRIINGSAATYFWLQFAGGKMKIVAADGNDIQPVEVDKLLIATAETYDVVIHLPDARQFEFRATAQDIKGYSSAYFGSGQMVRAKDIPAIDYFKTMAQMNDMMAKMRQMGMKMTMGIKMKDKNMPAPPMNELQGIEQNMDTMQMQGREMNPNMRNAHADEMKGMNMNNMNMPDTTMPMKMMMMRKMKMMKGMKLSGFDVPPGLKGDEKILSYDMIHSDTSTALPSNRPWREIHLTLSGTMMRYVWSINGRTLSKLDEQIKINRGENVRIYFMNATMMEHPMHLHGHFFRVLNEGETQSPMKHTVNINPMGMSIIEFEATEQKDWFLHCHTLYHMIAGMATVISYSGTESRIQKTYTSGYQKFLKRHGSNVYLWGNAMIQSQASFLNATLSSLKWQMNVNGNIDWSGAYESEVDLRRFIDKRQFLSAFIGSDNRRTIAETQNEVGETVRLVSHKDLATAGITYLLPMFISVEGRVDHEGSFRFQVARRDFPLTNRIRLDAVWNTDKEFQFGTRYIIRKNFGISANYDSDYGWGAGIDLRY